MVQGRRASEGEAPTSIWLDPPSSEEAQDFLAVLQAMRCGAFAVQSLPGAAHRGAFRIRGLDQPPRQGIVTPASSSPESLAEPSPRGLARSRIPVAARAWCPARAFATQNLVTLAAGANGTGLSLGRTRPCGVAQLTEQGMWRPAWAPWSAEGGAPGPASPRLRWGQRSGRALGVSMPHWASRGRGPRCRAPRPARRRRPSPSSLPTSLPGPLDRRGGPEFGCGGPHPPGGQVEG